MDFWRAANNISAQSGRYTGGPIELFEEVGRNTFITALQNGLTPDQKFLDFGAGSLRLGYWFIRFMESGCYHAIEPSRATVQAGIDNLFSPGILEEKQPRFHYSSECDMGFFETRFEFVVARSILTHTTPGMLDTIFREFAECAAGNAVMMASYWPATGWKKCTIEGPVGDKLPDDDWRFIRCVKYSLKYLQRIGSNHGLRVVEFKGGEPIINQQRWLRIWKGL